MAIKRDPNDVCGYTPFNLPPDHPFTPACRIHDWEFDQEEQGAQDKSRRTVDAELLKRMLLIARNNQSFSLRVQAYTYYALARIFGGIMW